MSVVYSMYDALVSINVPSDKAKAVIDAMEREMMDKVATKADLEHVQEVLSKDIRATKADLEHLRELLSRDISGVNERIASQTHAITLRLILTAVGLVPAIIAAQKLL
jgi:predicted  nucleic acid-binding Zn-ribbon protein